MKVGRFCGVDPEKAIRRSCEKFIRRFAGVEGAVLAAGKRLEDCTLDEMLAIYQTVKNHEHS